MLGLTKDTLMSHGRITGPKGWVGISMALRGIIFVLHGVFPMVTMPKKFSLEATVEKITAWNEYAKKRADP